MKERFCCGQPIKSNKRVAPSVSAPLHLILRAPSPASHEWKHVAAVKRLCQVCHLVVDGQGVRCKSCGLRAHPQCGSNYPANLNLKAYGPGGEHGRSVSRTGGGSDSITSYTDGNGHRRNRNSQSQDSSHHSLHFEPRIKKILHAPLLSSIESGCEERHSGASSGRFSSSCGDSVAASTAIVVGTVSIETPRSESKTPEITITPGSEVAAVGAEIEARLLSSSASVSELPDSGCTGLLDEEDDSPRAESSVAPEISDRKGGGPPGLSNQRLLYVDGPLDGSPYAVINPLVKQKSLGDSGISVDQMKDLDRLISALVQEAESIDIPYHARQDSLPFSYTSPQSITSQTEKRLQQSQQTSYSTVDSRQPHYSSASSYAAAPADLYGSSSRDTHQNHRGYQSSVEQQYRDPQPISYGGLSRSISHQPAATSFNSYEQRSQPASSVVHESASSNSFNLYGNGATGGVRRMRSQSADGRRDYERDEDADEWLARQMQKLQEKRASKNTMRTDWLAELKSVLPSERSQTQTDHSSSAMSDFRHTSTSRAETTPVSTRANISYSSDEDDDVEMEVFHRGRKIQRHHSESAYDRGYTSSSSTRAPSQQSYTETPFPICPPTPYTNRPVSPGKPPRSPKGIRRYQGASSAPIGAVDIVPLNHMERAQTPVNPRPIFMVDSEVKFAQDLSEYWYKPFATREETVATLMQSLLGSFIIRNSNSFPGAYGLAIKVSDTGGEKSIRHFLIEPTRFGVRLRGCGTLEPVFSSLSALVYAHSIECLALPITLTLPAYDILPSSQSQSTTAHLLRQGAACQLLFLGMVGVECLSGDEAIQRGIIEISAASPVPISLRLSRSGLTLTDVFRKQFFRIHFSLNEISYASVVSGRSVAYGREVKQVFGIVARAPRAHENSVILLAELEHGQPANAIASFIQRVIAWQQH